MNIPITVLIAVVGLLFTALSFIIGRVTATKDKSYKEGKKDGEIISSLNRIDGKMDDVIMSQKNTDKKLDEHGERITRVEESTKQAHHRLNAIDGRKTPNN